MILAVTLSCGAIALFASWRVPRIYAANVTLIVTRSKIAEEPLPPASLPTFQALFRNRGLASQIIEEFNLRDLQPGLTAVSFVASNLSVDQVPGTDLLRARVLLHDPDMAANVANRLAELAVELNQRLNLEETIFHRDSITKQVDEARDRVGKLGRELLAFRRETRIELLQAEVHALVAQHGRMPDLTLQIQSETARLRKAEEELAKHEQIVKLTKSIANDPVALEIARQRGGGTSDLLQFELSDEELNPVYEVLAQEVAIGRSRLAALIQQHDAVESDGSRLEKLTELYEGEAHLSKLELEFRLAEAIYEDSQSRFEQARSQVASRIVQVQIVDPAGPPSSPTLPRTRLNVLLALGVGLTVAMVAAFVTDSFQTHAS